MAAANREIPAEDSIKVVCRFRPLNDSEEKAGSRFVVKFPQGQEENCISIGVSWAASLGSFHRFSSATSEFSYLLDGHDKMRQATFRVYSWIFNFGCYQLLLPLVLRSNEFSSVTLHTVISWKDNCL